MKAADRLRPTQGQAQLKTVFPGEAFGRSIKAAMQVLAAGDAPKNGHGVAVIRLTLNGFDTHQNQPGQQAVLLRQLAEGMASMKSAPTASTSGKRGIRRNSTRLRNWLKAPSDSTTSAETGWMWSACHLSRRWTRPRQPR